MSTRYLSLYDQHEEVTGNSLLNDWFQRVGMVLGGAEHVQFQQLLQDLSVEDLRSERRQRSCQELQDGQVDLQRFFQIMKPVPFDPFT